MEKKFKVTHIRDYCNEQGLPFYVYQSPRIDLTLFVPIIGEIRPTPVGRSYVFCAGLNDVIVYGIDALTITPNNNILFHHLCSWHYNTDGVLSPLVSRREGDDFYVELGANIGNVDVECVYTGHSDIANFGHLLWQGLARLAVINEEPELAQLPVAVPDHLPPRMYEFYDLLGYTADRRVLYKVGQPTRFKKLWMPSLPFYRGNIGDGLPYIWDKAIWFLRDRLTRGMTRQHPGRRVRLFIGRDGARYRKILNFDEVAAILSEKGFIEFNPADFPAKEQIRLFSAAEIIVFAAGGASSVPLLAASDCVLVELLPKGVEFFVGGAPTYAAVTRQPLERIFGDAFFAPENPSAEKAKTESLHNRDKDFKVPLDYFSKTVAVAVEMVERRNPLDIRSMPHPSIESVLRYRQA